MSNAQLLRRVSNLDYPTSDIQLLPGPRQMFGESALELADPLTSRSPAHIKYHNGERSPQHRLGGNAPAGARLEANNVKVLNNMPPTANLRKDNSPLSQPCKSSLYKMALVSTSSSRQPPKQISTFSKRLLHQLQKPACVGSPLLLPVLNNSTAARRDVGVVDRTACNLSLQIDMPYRTASGKSSPKESLSTGSTTATINDDYMVTRSRAHKNADDYDYELEPVSASPQKSSKAECVEQEQFHYSTEDRFKALHIYKCLKHPDHVRFHLNNWEQRQKIDMLAENTDRPTGDDDAIPSQASYLIVAEEMICDPHFGSALFFASKDEATSRFTLHVGLYYSFGRMTHTCLPSIKHWADDRCDDQFPVLRKDEVIRSHGVCRPRFLELYGRCGRAVDAEFRDRLSGPKWAVWLGAHRRRALRRKKKVIEQ